MIRFNLLDSVTERQGGAVLAVERKASSPVTRLLLMAIAVFVMTFGVIGWDVISTVRAKAEAGRQLEEQKRKAAELEAVMKEQKELEAKIKNIDLRIEAIKKLRSSQAGPSAVLEALRERIKMTPDIHLLSVDQQGDQLTIKGSSRNELAITQFGRSLEFSGGLFSNLGIETQRKEIVGQTVSVKDAEPPKIEVVDFTIKCAYTPEKGSSSGAALAAESGGAPADNRNQTASGPKS
jgi:Tfp pilus assembly protein PilN